MPVPKPLSLGSGYPYRGGGGPGTAGSREKELFGRGQMSVAKTVVLETAYNLNSRVKPNIYS